MVIYKYVKPNGDDIIKNLRIKVSSILDFNDPFELRESIKDITPGEAAKYIDDNESCLRHIHKVVITEGKTDISYEAFLKEMRTSKRREEFIERIVANSARVLRATVENSRKDLSKIALVGCFCGESMESHHEILMWSHYTDGHKGLRIGFNKDLLLVQGTSFAEIKYEPRRLQLNPLECMRENRDDILNVFYRRVMEAKSLVWKYENEHRWYVSSKLCQKDKEDLFISISPEVIVEIVCGVNCSSKQMLEIKNLVKIKFGNGVKVKKAEIDNYEFKLNYVEC
jgi:hypothetical protein